MYRPRFQQLSTGVRIPVSYWQEEARWAAIQAAILLNSRGNSQRRTYRKTKAKARKHRKLVKRHKRHIQAQGKTR